LQWPVSGSSDSSQQLLSFVKIYLKSLPVADQLVSSIGRGLCVLVGISRDDTSADMDYMVKKILNLRLFDSDDGKRWGKNVMDNDFEVLCVSQV
jgi:D-tyrosyl-tRNA(Tyr) deacylase